MERVRKCKERKEVIFLDSTVITLDSQKTEKLHSDNSQLFGLVVLDFFILFLKHI